jgi:hypothetical protein
MISAESGAIAPLLGVGPLPLTDSSLVRKAENRPLWLRCRTPQCSWTTKRPGDPWIAGAHLLHSGL